MKKYLAENDNKFYIINATKVAEEIGLGSRTNTIMQAAFFKLSNVIPFEDAVKQMKDAIKKTYGRKSYEEQFTLKIPEYLEKTHRIIDIYKKQATGIPKTVFETLEEQLARLEQTRKQHGDYIAPDRFQHTK